MPCPPGKMGVRRMHKCSHELLIQESKTVMTTTARLRRDRLWFLISSTLNKPHCAFFCEKRLWWLYFTRALKKNKLCQRSFKNLHRFLVTGSLTSFDMSPCCQEHWNIVPGALLWKAFMALQAEVMFSNSTTALCRPQRLTDLIGPNTDSFWITERRSSVGFMFFFSHLAREQMEAVLIRILISFFPII